MDIYTECQIASNELCLILFYSSFTAKFCVSRTDTIKRREVRNRELHEKDNKQKKETIVSFGFLSSVHHHHHHTSTVEVIQ